jgi:Transposase DDE domain
MEVISKLLSFVSDDLLDKLAISTEINKFSKKLQGQLLFKLLLYCIVTEKDNSLRGMQSALESAVFNILKPDNAPNKISHSSISDRFSNMKSKFFEEIFHSCLHTYKSSLGEETDKIIRFDSTIVTLSGRLLKNGYHLKGGAADNYKLLKFTIGFTNVPEAVYFYNDQKYNSENVALSESILAHNKKGNDINVFDRGLNSIDHYDKLSENNIRFISRISNNPKYTEYRKNTIVKPLNTKSLKIVSDKWVYLYTMRSSRTFHPFRLITAIKKIDNEYITFISNIDSEDPKEITEIYKSRWDIEIFFKFIKQHLNFSHLLNRSENGIQSVLYVTMTAAILLMHYKQQQKLKGFKMVKRKFAQELERDIIYTLVIMCDGNPTKAKEMIYKNSS